MDVSAALIISTMNLTHLESSFPCYCRLELHMHSSDKEGYIEQGVTQDWNRTQPPILTKTSLTTGNKC